MHVKVSLPSLPFFRTKLFHLWISSNSVVYSVGCKALFEPWFGVGKLSCWHSVVESRSVKLWLSVSIRSENSFILNMP